MNRTPWMLLAAIAAPAVALAAGENLLVTDSKWNTTGNLSFGLASTCWTNAAGNSVSWSSAGGADTICRIEGLPNNVSMTGDWSMYGIQVDQKYGVSSALCLLDYTATYRVGAGGIEALAGSLWFANSTGTDKVILAEDQTWRGGRDATTQIGIGYGAGKYAHTRLAAATGVMQWNVEGRLNVWLESASNDLRTVDVAVSSPAKLFLLADVDAVLRAHKLTLVGDGERLPLGRSTGVSGRDGVHTTICALDVAHVAEALELRDGADISTASAATFDIPSVSATGEAGSRSEVTGTIVFSRETTLVDVASGVTLAFVGANRAADGVAAGISLSGSGTLELAPGLNGAISVAGGATLVLTGEGKYGASISGAGSLVVASSGVAYLGGCDLSGYTGERIDVTSGILEIGSMADLGDNVKIRTTGDAKILLGTTEGLDESRLEGTKAYETDPWLVTDAVRADAALIVGAGDVLRVLGNGLTASTALTLNGGTVRFEVNGATIGSPLSVVACSYMETSSGSVTGCISGAVTASIPAGASPSGLRVSGPGCVDFTGGGTFTGSQSSIRARDGASIRLRTGTFSLAGASLMTDKTSSDWGRYIGITDGAVVTLTGTERSGVVLAAKIDGTYYDKTAVFEVSGGAVCTLAENIHVAIGSDQARGMVVVNDGTLKVGGRILLGYENMGTGIVDLRAGTLELSRAMWRFASTTASYQGQGRIDWSGGTIRLSSSFGASEPYLIRNASGGEDERKRLRVWTRITGSCVLDLAELSSREVPLANVPTGFDRAEWFGTGVLTVKGGKPFVMNSIGDGVGLRLEGDGTRVILPSDVQVFGYDVCAPNMDVPPYKDRYSTTNTVLPNLSMPTFVAAGRGVSLSNDSPTMTISISEASAVSGGCFDNVETLVGPGVYSVTNLTFAAGAVMGARTGAPSFSVAGTLTLPSVLEYLVSRGASGAMPQAAFTANGGIDGNPAWSRADGSLLRQPRIDAAEGALWFDMIGFILTVH